MRIRIVGFVLLVAGIAAAQTTSTEILGTVTDATGAVVPDAKVTLHRVATGERREAVTGSTGSYSFPFIEIGDYTVTAAAEGFKTEEKTGILVQLQQKARVDFRMEVGATTERVEVVAVGTELKTDDAAVGQVIDNKRVLELPLNGRNIAGLAVLTPGVQFGIRMGLDGLGTGAFPFPGAATAVSANGQRELNQQVTLDGVTATEPLINIMLFTPSIDAIEEFRVQTSSYSAEYGMNSGAVVQIALRSGTNKFRGTLYEFLRNDAVDAKDYFLNFQLPPGARAQPKNRLRRNQFGAFVSGPVELPGYHGQDRTFWSFNYEGKRETQEYVREAFWFPAAFRNGDFSALLAPLVRDGRAIRSPIIIYDPLTGEPFRDGQGRITNIIPASRINRNAQNFVNKYLPPPMFQPDDILDLNVRATVPAILRTNQYFTRVDHQFSPKDRIFGRLALDRTGYDQINLNPNFPQFNTTASTNVAFQHLHIFNPRVLNEFRYGFNKNDLSIFNPRTNTDFDTDALGIGQFRVSTDNNRKFTRREAGVPPVGVVGGDAIGRDVFSDVHQITDNFSVIRGNHSFKTGFEYRRYDLFTIAANVPVGNLGCCEGGYPLAGWLLGYPTSSSTAEGLPPTEPIQKRWGAYFLDEWKVTRKLTMNLGLRWDFFQVPLDAAGGMRSLRLEILSQAADGRRLPTLIPEPNTKNFPLYDTDNRYFMPRVGLAYRATDKWVVRSGFGWFVNAQQINNTTILALLPPRSGTFQYLQVTDTAQVIQYPYAGQNFNIQTRRFRPGSPVLTLDNIYPGQGTTSSRTNLTVMPPDNRASSHVQWSLDIQRSLPWKTFITVGYVGSKTSHLDNSIGNFNSPDPSPDTDINRRRPWQAYVSRGEGNDARLLGNIRYLDSYSNASYHGLQTAVEKRYSSGLTMSLAYTFSKALGEGYGRNDSAGEVSGAYQNPRNRRADRTRFGFDVTHNFVYNYVYEMPFLNRFHGVAGAFLAGWQTNGIITIRTGFPFSLAGGNLNTGSGTYPDRVADGRLGSDATRQKWFDPGAFRRVDCNIPNRSDLCHYGNAGNGILTSPGATNFDLSFYKNWRLPMLGEAGRLQFRSELFNAFNTPQFGRPNGIGFATLDSIVPDTPRQAEIRSLRLPMRIIQFGIKLYF